MALAPDHRAAITPACLRARTVAPGPSIGSSPERLVVSATRKCSASSAAMQPGPGRRDRLAVLLVLDVAGGEHARRRGLGRARRRDDVALVVAPRAGRRGTRCSARGRSRRTGRRPGSRARRSVLRSLTRTTARRALPPSTVDDLVRQQELDLRVLLRALLHDLRRAQLVAAVDDVDLATRTW